MTVGNESDEFDPHDPDTPFMQGLFNTLGVIDDSELLQISAQTYRRVRDDILPHIQPGEIPGYALAALLEEGYPKPLGVVLLLKGRVILAWQKGMFRKQTVTKVVSLAELTEVGWREVGGSPLLTISAGDSTGFWLPRGADDAATVLVKFIAEAARS